LEGRRDVGELLNQPPAVRDVAEAVMLVEGRGRVVDGVDHDEPCRNRFGCGKDPIESVGEERGPEAPALKRSVERETCEQHRGYLPRAATAENARKLFALEQVCRERVVRDHHEVVAMPDECTRSPPGLGGEGMLEQPAIEFITSAGKRVETMRFAQRLGLVRRQGYRRTERRASAPARASAGFGCGGSSSALSS
jgi:hypothetical protein